MFQKLAYFQCHWLCWSVSKCGSVGSSYTDRLSLSFQFRQAVTEDFYVISANTKSSSHFLQYMQRLPVDNLVWGRSELRNCMIGCHKKFFFLFQVHVNSYNRHFIRNGRLMMINNIKHHFLSISISSNSTKNNNNIISNASTVLFSRRKLQIKAS